MFGGSSAAESARLYGVRGAEGNAPRGAMVFYASHGSIQGRVGEWGHVGLSLGDGQVVHAWDEVRIDPVVAVELLERGDGWSAPRLLGWVPPQRFLRGWRTRAWA